MIFFFFWRLILSWNSSGFFCWFLSFEWTITLKKKKEKKCYPVSCTSNCFVPICRLSVFFFPFFHCTFNLRCFLYLLDINVLPFLIGLYKFFFPLIFKVLKCGGGVVSTGVEAAYSLVLAPRLLPFSWNIFNIYLEYNVTFFL